MKRINKQKGFTLIELMIVISIIALLAVILVPSLLNSRKQAVILSCASNLTELFKGLSIYSSTISDTHTWPIQTGHAFWDALRTDPQPQYAAYNTVQDPKLNKIFVCPFQTIAVQQAGTATAGNGPDSYQGPAAPISEVMAAGKYIGGDQRGAHDNVPIGQQDGGTAINIMDSGGSIEKSLPGKPQYIKYFTDTTY